MISHHKAQEIMLAAMGLQRPPAPHATKADALQAIQRMGVLQIDTISVVARSPYLVLWSRLGSYEPSWLDDLLAEGALFEGWAHAACFLPIEQYPLLRRLTLEEKPSWSDRWLAANTSVVEGVLGLIRERGEVKSAHFDQSKKDPGGWWNWKAEKIALEALFSRGDLMIKRREGFQRVYALRQHVLPDWSDEAAPPKEAVYRQLILQSVKALGITTPAWVADYYRLRKSDALPHFKALVSEGHLQAVTVEGWSEPAYLHPDHAHWLEEDTTPSVTVLLSPFDPLVWDRKRVAAMFNFDYLIECYTPAAKRVYGYFTLPILHRGDLVGRLDAKAHRKQGRFEVKALHLEQRIKPNAALAKDIIGAVRRCAEWHATPTVEVVRTTPPSFLPLVQQHL